MGEVAKMAVDVRGLTASDTEKLDVWFKFACSKIEVTTWNMRQNDYVQVCLQPD